MAKAISNRNIVDARFDVVDFTDKWLASFGRPELRGSWIIYGNSGSGKTTFALQLAKYLTRFDRVAYDTLEQGLTRTFQMAWNRVGMKEVGRRIIVYKKEPIEGLRKKLSQKKSPNIVFIDSLTALVGFTRRGYIQLLEDYPNKLFIFLAHEKNGRPDPAIAELVRRLSEIKIRVEGYTGFVTTRFGDPEKGEGEQDFIIWEKGAEEYWVNHL